MIRTVLPAIATILVLASLGVAAEDEHTLQVTGTAEVSVAPDICYMNFQVSTEHRKSAREAYRENNRIMDDLAAAIRGQGVESRDIQTRNFAVSPQYHWDEKNDRQVFDGYRVSHSLHVALREADKVSGVLDAAVEAGATEVGSVTFTVENPKKYLADARVEAIKAAQAKAEIMARTAGVQLLKPISIREQEPYPSSRYAAQANVSFQLATVAGADAVSLEPGEVRLSQTVHVTYGIR